MKNAWSNKVDPKFNRGTCNYEISFKKSTSIQVLHEGKPMIIEEDKKPIDIFMKDVDEFQGQRVRE